MKTIKGLDILHVFPFVELPSKRGEGHNTDVFGWGRVLLPNISSEGLTQMMSKEDVIEWILEFKTKYEEDPEIALDKHAAWFAKCIVKNEAHEHCIKQYTDKKREWMSYHKTTE